MQTSPFDQSTERLAWCEQVGLADELVEARGPHPVGERSPAPGPGRGLQIRASHVSSL